MLTRIGESALRWAMNDFPFNRLVGVARSLLALNTLATLLANRSQHLFVTTSEFGQPLLCGGSRAIGLFCALGSGRLDLARVLSMLALLLVASGWRPRVTGIAHWYISFSFQANATVLDGGDQISALLCLLLLPLTLADRRTWHWQPSPALDPERLGDALALVVARTSLAAVRVQVSVIYFLAAVGKLQVQEWINGTVLYYWFEDSRVGAAPWLRSSLDRLYEDGSVLAVSTWLVLLLEFALAAGIVMRRRYHPALLGSGILLHASILLVQGIASLSVTMIAALILYVHVTFTRSCPDSSDRVVDRTGSHRGRRSRSQLEGASCAPS